MEEEFGFGIIAHSGAASDPQFLLIERAEGFWEFPKGHAEEGETNIETATREFNEETGLTPHEVDQSHSFVTHYQIEKEGRTIEKTVTYFLAAANPESRFVLPPHEVKSAEWLSCDEARERLSFNNLKDILEEVMAYLDNRRS